MIGRKGLVNTTLAAAVVIVGFGAYSTVGTSAASTGTVTNTATATSGNVLQTVSATGNVMAPLQAAATFTQAGVITKIMVKLGDVVTAGEPIATIDDSAQQAALTVAQNGLTATQAAIAKVNAGLAPADQAAVTVSDQQALAAVEAAKASASAAVVSAGQDAANLQTAVDTASSNLSSATAQLTTDSQTLDEDRSAYTSAQVTADPQAPPGEDTNQAALRYQQDQDACTAKNTPGDGVQCTDVATLNRLLQAVSSQAKATTSSSKNAVTQAYNSLVSAKRSRAAGAAKDSQPQRPLSARWSTGPSVSPRARVAAQAHPLRAAAPRRRPQPSRRLSI